MLDKSLIPKVLELKKKDKTLREIGAELGIGKTTVASILKKHSTVVPEVAEPTESPKIIISEMDIMDKGDTSAFLNSLGSVPDSTMPTPSASAKDNFLKSFMADIKPIKTQKEPKTPKPKAKKIDFDLDNFIATTKPKEVKEPSKPLVPSLEKGELIARITLYTNTFPEVLKDYIKPDRVTFIDSLQKKSQTELSALMNTMDYSRTIDNTAKVMKSLTITGAAMVEMASKRFLRMRTDGFSNVIASIPELDSLLKEIAMENKDNIISRYQSPSIRLTTLVVTTLIAVDARNRANGGAVQYPSQQTNQPVNEETAEKYNEL
jgi:hypothetical protein